MKTSRINNILATHKTFLLILAAFTVLRLLSILVLRPGGFIADHGPDQTYYFEMARLTGTGELPFFDFWMEYPPLMPWLATLAYHLSLNIPVWTEPIFWFNVLFRLFLLPFDVATLILIYAIVCHLWNQERAVQVAGLWALLFTPLFTLLTWFDPLTLFFGVLALYGLILNRPALAGGAIGLGFLAKIIPVAISPVGMFSLLSHRQRVIYVGSAAAAVFLVLLLPLLLAPAYVISWVRALLNVSAWETVWALLEGYRGYGLVAPLSGRNDPATAVFSANESTLSWWPITLVFILIYVYFITRRIDWQNKQRLAQFSLFSLVIFVLYSKGYSPQWATYLSALALIALPVGRGLGYSLLLSGLMVAEWPVAFVMLADNSAFLAAIIVWRTVVILLLGLDGLVRALPDGRRWQRIGQRWTFPAALILSLVSLLILSPFAARAYANSRQQADDLAPFIADFQPRATPDDLIVVTQPGLLERLRPFLPNKQVILMPNTWTDVDVPGWLAAQLTGYDRVWLLFDNKDSSGKLQFDEARQQLDKEACPAQQTWYGAAWAGSYVVNGAGKRRVETAVFAGGLRLTAASIPEPPFKAGAALCLRLAWLADAPLQADYTVFVHLLDANGTLAAQSDIWPAQPTSAWPAAEPVATAHGLILPATLPPGRYTLQVGLYEPGSGVRLLTNEGLDSWLMTEVEVIE
jgi:hypothetical protein